MQRGLYLCFTIPHVQFCCHLPALLSMFALGSDGCVSSAQVILQHSQLDEEHLTPGGICANRLLFENNLGSDAIELLGGGPHSFAFLVLRGAEATRRHHSPMNPQTIAKLCMCRRYGMWWVHTGEGSHHDLVEDCKESGTHVWCLGALRDGKTPPSSHVTLASGVKYSTDQCCATVRNQPGSNIVDPSKQKQTWLWHF